MTRRCKRTADTELLKLPAYRPDADTPMVHTYLAAPTTPDEEDLVDMDEPTILQHAPNRIRAAHLERDDGQGPLDLTHYGAIGKHGECPGSARRDGLGGAWR